MFSDTIAAISTPLQEGAISIIRISGEDALPIVNSIFSKDLSQKESHTITYGYIYDNDTLVDEVLVSVFRAPKTYTREDVVEINAHGGVFITRKILGLLLQRGARLARPGEFTQRAFYHQPLKLPLTLFSQRIDGFLRHLPLFYNFSSDKSFFFQLEGLFIN